MKATGISNDNSTRDADGNDRQFAKDAMANLCVLLKEQGIDRHVIADAMLDELFKMLDGNPFRSPGDEFAVRGDQQFLWRLKHRVLPMSEQWDKGWIRIRREKGAAPAFARAIDGEPIIVPAAVKRRAPPPDYDESRHRTDLFLLRMRPGHVYTEHEVLTRYRRKLALVLSRKKGSGVEHASTITAAKKRIIGWMERTGQIVRDRTAG